MTEGKGKGKGKGKEKDKPAPAERAVGQVYESNDPRDHGRRVTLMKRVVKNGRAHWLVSGHHGRKTMIREDRLGTNRRAEFKLVTT